MIVRVAVSALLALVVLTAGDAVASPTMIRLGYQSCTPCHLSPQGGGLLSDYGKGVDRAQSLFVREYTPQRQQQWRFYQDVRAQFGLQENGQAATGTWNDAEEVKAWHRAALVHGRQRVTTILGFDFGSVVASTSNRPQITVSRATWEVRPAEGIEFSLGKDALPSPLGLPDVDKFKRDFIEPGTSPAPSQAKLFLWTRRTSLTTYGFGPGGDETTAANRSSGGGVLGSVTLWSPRLVVGTEARLSRSTARDEHRAGAFARLGFGRWGVLAEHERVVSRDQVSAAREEYVGTSTFFAAPYEWLVASVGGQYSLDRTTAARNIYRISPSVQVRVSDNFTFVVTEREIAGEADASRGRTVAIQVFVKTVR